MTDKMITDFRFFNFNIAKTVDFLMQATDNVDLEMEFASRGINRVKLKSVIHELMDIQDALGDKPMPA